MECKYCGAKLRDGANFCPKCGRKVKPVMPGGARPGPEVDLTGRKTKQKAQTEPSKRQTLPQAENGLSGQKMTDDVEWTGVALSSGQDSSQKRKKGCLIAGIAGAVILAAAAAAHPVIRKRLRTKKHKSCFHPVSRPAQIAPGGLSVWK